MGKKVVLSLAGGVLFWMLMACSAIEEEPLPTLVPVIQLPQPTETPAPDPTASSELASEPDPTLAPTEPTATAAVVPLSNRGAMVYVNSIGEGLFLANPSEATQTQYYALQGVEKLLPASFNGERIGLIRDGRLYIARTDGSGLVEITAVSNPSWLIWSPTKDEFALVDNGDLVVLQADSGAANRLTSGMQLADIPGSVAWSPDGRELLFTCGAQATDLCRVASDGSGAILNITNNGADSFAWYREPTWSPDGSKISYVSPDDDKNLQLFMMNADGSDRQQLTEGAGQNSLHQWSPDGVRIAYANFADGTWRALAVDVDGAGQLDLTGMLSDLDSVIPKWGPTGENAILLYTTNSAVNAISVALVSLGETAVTPITDNGWQLQWSSNGQQIAYIADDAQIYVQAVTATTPFVVNCQSGCDSFVWLP